MALFQGYDFSGLTQSPLPSGCWTLICHLPGSGNRQGSYGAASRMWEWAKLLCKKHPTKLRIVDEA